MKLTYDRRSNIAYLRFAEKQTEVETIRVSDDLNVDLAPGGKVYGIELLNANDQLQEQATGKLVIENEASGESVEVALP